MKNIKHILIGPFSLRRRPIVSHQYVRLVPCLDSAANPLSPNLLFVPKRSLTSFTENPFFTVANLFQPRLSCFLRIKSSCIRKSFQLTFVTLGVDRFANDPFFKFLLYFFLESVLILVHSFSIRITVRVRVSGLRLVVDLPA